MWRRKPVWRHGSDALATPDPIPDGEGSMVTGGRRVTARVGRGREGPGLHDRRADLSGSDPVGRKALW